MANLTFSIQNIPNGTYNYVSPYYTTPSAMTFSTQPTDAFWTGVIGETTYTSVISDLINAYSSECYISISIEDIVGNEVFSKSIQYWDGSTSVRAVGWYVLNKKDDWTDIIRYLGERPAISALMIPSYLFAVKTTGIYIIKYDLVDTKTIGYRYYVTANIALTYNRLPLKKWTITDVVNRCFDLIEPLKYGEKPRFRFQGQNYDDTTGNPTTKAAKSQAEKYDKILSPEYAFTRQTLKEMLDDVGGYIHAVPKVTRRVAEDNGEVWFEVAFEEYGSHRTSHIKGMRYCGRGSRENINDYCTGLDSSAENLISQLDGIRGGGTVTEPYDNYLTNEQRPMQSLRAENANVRIDENNGIIMTYKPINAIEKVLCRYIPGHRRARRPACCRAKLPKCSGRQNGGNYLSDSFSFKYSISFRALSRRTGETSKRKEFFCHSAQTSSGAVNSFLRVQ